MKNFPLILLAAGKSSRMGTAKGLVPFKGKTLLDFQIESYLSAGGENIFLVLGADQALYQERIPLTELTKIIHNPCPELGQFSSIQIALKELLLIRNYSGCFILPIDVPLIDKSILKKLINGITPDTKVCQPTYLGKGGHPVLVMKKWIKYLTELNIYDQSSRLDTQIGLLKQNEIKKITLDDKNILLNINTPDDLCKIIDS